MMIYILSKWITKWRKIDITKKKPLIIIFIMVF